MGYDLRNKAVPVWAIAQLLDEDNLRLPVFQRDAVWDEERVELLWDSLLRGIPVGNLVVGRSKASRCAQVTRCEKAPSLDSISEESEKDVLIDGQQRAAAIRQGVTDWKEGLSFRLWVDVDPSKEQRRKEHTVHYSLFLCTRGFPWGTGISDHQRRECRKKLQEIHPNEMEQQVDQLKPDYHLSLGYTWPAKAKLPIPFATITSWFVGELTARGDLANGQFREVQELSEGNIRSKVERSFGSESGCLVALHIREKWKSNLEKISGWIVQNKKAICQALNRKVYLEVAFQGRESPEQDLGEAFNRINRLGMRLDGADLFFSALKLQWPKAHDLVWEIYSDKDAGKLLAPPQIVHTVVRLAIADHNEQANRKNEKIADRPDLNLSDARILLNEDSHSNIRDGIEGLIGLGEAKRGQLQDLFRRLRDILLYRGSELPGGEDFGLSLPLLARLGERKPHIFHNIILWLHRNSEPIAGKEEVRRKIVRYALVDYLFLKAKNEYRRESFKACAVAEDFPDTRLIQLAVDLECVSQAFFMKKESDLLLVTPEDLETRIKDGGDPTDLTDLLLWSQRCYLHDKFPDYDPTLFYNAAALPWDKDHIWPQAKMDGRSYPPEEDAKEDCRKSRESHLHSIGNLSLWDRRENRGAHDKLPGEKYSESDVKQFAIRNDVFELFRELALENGKITRTFLEKFREAVNARRVSLYTQLYETLCLKDLKDLRRESDSHE